MDKGVFFKRADGGRIMLYDTLRGLMIVLMIIFHSAFDIYYIFGRSFGFLQMIDSPVILLLRSFVAVCFIVLSGICTNYSRNVFRRGVIVFCFGLVVTLATALVTPETAVRFGILSLLGTSMILIAVLKPFHELVSPMWGMLIGGAAFFATVFIFPLHTSIDHLYFLGFVRSGFTSGDFYPLIPYYFAFLAGHFLGRILVDKGYDKKYGGLDIHPFSFIGRNSVYFYLAHQPIVYGLCWLLFVKLGI